MCNLVVSQRYTHICFVIVTVTQQNVCLVIAKVVQSVPYALQLLISKENITA